MLLKFIYLSQCDIEDSELAKVLSAGKDLKIIGLTEDNNVNDINIIFFSIKSVENYPII